MIQSARLTHSPNHIPPAASAHRIVQCLLDGSRLRHERADPICAARSAGSDPSKTCGFAAQWVFPNHTHRARVAPGELFPPGRGESSPPSSGGSPSRRVAGRDAARINAASRRPRVYRDPPPNSAMRSGVGGRRAPAISDAWTSYERA